MESLGAQLKAAREQKHLTLSQAASDTRISAVHLANLEAGRYEELPGGMYNRAFLRAYSDYLGLDAQAMLDSYNTETSPSAEKPPKPKASHRFVEPRLSVSPVAAWSLMLLLAVMGLYFSRRWISSVFSPYFTKTQVAASPAAERSVPVHESRTETQGTGAVAPAPGFAARQAADAALPPLPPGSMRLRLEITQDCWVSVTSDGNRVLVRLLAPGETQTVDAAERFYVILGNAGGVRATINGKPLKPLGGNGEVVKVLINQQTLDDLLERPAG